MKIYSLITSLLLFAHTSSMAQDEPHDDRVITRIAFGSCNNPRNKSKGMLDTISTLKADVFVFLGDNIYGDTKDMKVLSKKYDELRRQPGFEKLRKTSQILATWDDHDYGTNNAGKSFPMKKEAQKQFLDFFQEPENSLRRQRPGIYSSHTFGEKGKVCQIILLDTRYFLDELPNAKYDPGTKPKNIVGVFKPTKDTSKTILGDAQWKWLEQQLQKPADFRIIASSTQILAVEKGMENWGNMPHEQQRLFKLLKKHKANNTIGISGDVHFAELSKKDIGGYPFYDFTSSGMTHTKLSWSKTKNSLRVGESFAELNAGLIDINWATMTITLQIIDQNGKAVMTHNIPLSELQFK